MTSNDTQESLLNFDPTSDDISKAELLDIYFKLFPNRSGTGIKRPQDSSWRSMSQYHQLSDLEILQVIEKSSELSRAFCLEAQTNMLVITIGSQSTYRNADFISTVRAALKARGISSCLYQFQEDWNLYIFFERKVETELASAALQIWCEKLGMKSGKDGIIVHDGTSLIPFPLQNDFVWLNDRCQRLIRRDELSFEDALRFLLFEATKTKNSPDSFFASFQSAVYTPKASKFDETPLSLRYANSRAQNNGPTGKLA